jgi:hypothetical protein
MDEFPSLISFETVVEEGSAFVPIIILLSPEYPDGSAEELK